MGYSIVADKTYKFSIRIIRFHLHLCNTHKDVYCLSRQLLRSGTSIGANVEEALGGHTEKDFAAKMNIAYKEARETKYWLRLLGDCNLIEARMYFSLTKDIDELIKILGSIIKTVKAKRIKNSRIQTSNS